MDDRLNKIEALIRVLRGRGLDDTEHQLTLLILDELKYLHGEIDGLDDKFSGSNQSVSTT
jgi:hypothetical protein